MLPTMIVRTYEPEDRPAVLALWQALFAYPEARNQPAFVLDGKLRMDDDLLFVALDQSRVVGTLMAGYDGHRGWLYRLAVDERSRGRGVARALVSAAERTLAARGCAKINLQTHHDNVAAVGFWRHIGYAEEARVSMGKTLGAKSDGGC